MVNGYWFDGKWLFYGTVQLKKVSREHMKPKWNGDFHSGQNKMVHSIPAGMKWSIPFRPE